ncbi:MAG: hypothetical protein WC890_04385 [Candidatus Margulisiibacteriota bacterium]
MIILPASGVINVSHRIVVPKGFGHRLETPNFDRHCQYQTVAARDGFSVSLKVNGGHINLDLTSAALADQECFSRVVAYFLSPECARLSVDACVSYGHSSRALPSDPIAVTIEGQLFSVRFVRNAKTWAHCLSEGESFLGQETGEVFDTAREAISSLQNHLNRASFLPTILTH